MLGVPGERLADGLAGGRVPHPHGVVVTAGGDPGAVGAERHADTASVWPVSGWPTGWPVAASHTRTVASPPPEAIRVPSGLNATPFTAVCVPGQRLADGLAGGRVPHPHGVVAPPEAMRVPSGLNATPFTAAGVWMILSVCRSLTTAVNSAPSSAVDATCCAARICLTPAHRRPLDAGQHGLALRRQPQRDGLAGTRVGPALGDGGPHEEQARPLRRSPA